MLLLLLPVIGAAACRALGVLGGALVTGGVGGLGSALGRAAAGGHLLLRQQRPVEATAAVAAIRYLYICGFIRDVRRLSTPSTLHSSEQREEQVRRHVDGMK